MSRSVFGYCRFCMQDFSENGIISFSGPISGPSIVIIGGTHGNERTGIAVVRTLRDDIAAGRRSVVSGVLTLILGNPEAIAQNVRAIDGRDLNRYFSPSMLANDDGSAEFQRAQIIASVVQASDIVIDIHAPNKPSVPFAIAKNDDAHRNIFRWFNPPCVLTDPLYIFGGGVPVTIDEYADSIGKVGFCFEAGWVKDESIIPSVIDSVTRYLIDVGIFAGEKITPPDIQGAIYEIAAVILRNIRAFSFAEGRGMSSFEPISSGDVLGYHDNDPVIAEHSGVIMFPKLLEHQAVGKPVCYLAKRVS